MLTKRISIEKINCGRDIYILYHIYIAENTQNSGRVPCGILKSGLGLEVNQSNTKLVVSSTDQRNVIEM